MIRRILKGAAVALLLLVIAVGVVLLHDMTNVFTSRAATSDDGGAPSPLALRLARVAGDSTLRLTHYGRKSNAPYDVTIWFAVDGETVYLPTADRNRQWGRNVLKNRRVGLAIGDDHFEGAVTPVTDQTEMLKLYDILRRKYWIIRLMSATAVAGGHDPHRDGLDLGEGGFFRVDLGAPTAPAQ